MSPSTKAKIALIEPILVKLKDQRELAWALLDLVHKPDVDEWIIDQLVVSLNRGINNLDLKDETKDLINQLYNVTTWI